VTLAKRTILPRVGCLNRGDQIGQAVLTKDDTPGWVVARASGLALFAYLDTDRHLEAIEFGAQPGAEDRAIYQAISLFDQPADALVAQLRQATVVINSDEEPDYPFTAPNLLLAFWRSTLPEGPAILRGKSLKACCWLDRVTTTSDTGRTLLPSRGG